MRWILTSLVAGMLVVTAGCSPSAEQGQTGTSAAPSGGSPMASSESSHTETGGEVKDAAAVRAKDDKDGEKAEDKTSGGPKKLAESAYKKITGGVKYAILQPGKGEKATGHREVLMHYTGWLEDGTKFDSSFDRKQPFGFELGSGMVIQGWEVGVEGMQKGEKRQLVIPASMGYGEQGYPPDIPGNATLIFEVELVDLGPAHSH